MELDLSFLHTCREICNQAFLIFFSSLGPRKSQVVDSQLEKVQLDDPIRSEVAVPFWREPLEYKGQGKCDVLNPPLYGEMWCDFKNDDEKGRVGSKCFFQCKNGWKTSKRSVLTCELSNDTRLFTQVVQWNFPPPICNENSK